MIFFDELKYNFCFKALLLVIIVFALKVDKFESKMEIFDLTFQ